MPQSHRGLADIVRLMPWAGDRLDDWVRVLNDEKPAVQAAAPAQVIALPPSGAGRAVLPEPQQRPTSGRGAPLQAPHFVRRVAEPWISADELRAPVSSGQNAAPTVAYHAMQEGHAPLCYLVPVTQLWPAMRRQRATQKRGIDLHKWTELMARAQWPQHPPRQTQAKTWTHVVLVWDQSFHLIPFRRDFALFEKQFRQLGLAQRITVLQTHGAHSRLFLPPDADKVVVLSDLGAATAHPHRGARNWLQALQPALSRSVPVQAWVPSHASRISALLVAKLSVISWAEASGLRPLRIHQALPPAQPPVPPDMQDLKLRMACALACHPPVLRRLRWLCGQAQGHPEWEALLWADPDPALLASELVLQWQPAKAASLRELFSTLSAAQQTGVWQALHAQHSHQARSTLMVERLLVAAHAGSTLQQQQATKIQEAWDWLEGLRQDQARHRVLTTRATLRPCKPICAMPCHA